MNRSPYLKKPDHSDDSAFWSYTIHTILTMDTLFKFEPFYPLAYAMWKSNEYRHP